MCGKPMYLLLSLAVALTSMAQGATIIWVADNLHYGSVEPNAPADQGFIDLLTAQGYEVIYKDQHDPVNGAQYWRVLDPNKIAELNAADLIIVARDCASGEYDDPNEAQWWNAITTPILLQGPHMARALPKWGWFSSTGTDAGTGVSLMQVVDPNHTIFSGVELDPNDQADILVPTIKSEFVKGAVDAGNGTVLAKRADTGLVWIAAWDTGQQYYEGSTQFAGGPRMFFASGAGGNKNNPVDGVYNLTEAGEKLFLNAVAYMLNKGRSIVFVSAMHPSTADANVPSDHGFVDLLRTAGYDVDYTKGDVAGTSYWETLDPGKQAILDAADLVIISRDCNSSGVSTDAAEIAAWDSVQSPVMLMSSYIAANNRWKWIDINSQDARRAYYDAKAADPNHPIFAGVALDANDAVQWYDPSVASGYASFINSADAGNGTVLAVRPDNGNILIAEWAAGAPFYATSTQTPVDVRMFFSAGTQEVSGEKTNWGVMNLNAEGQKVWLNAVRYLIDPPQADLDE
ncbi:MAG TPA: hypothetical protein PKH24_17110 [Sedimentisphaerales bacterium]|jgi:hypothetical protein|nr:hypothetical protein [Sedimentisphaerales bacterium]HNU31139.1 hypothetical protein [Sedimentisphaerales bacterium]